MVAHRLALTAFVAGWLAYMVGVVAVICGWRFSPLWLIGMFLWAGALMVLSGQRRARGTTLAEPDAEPTQPPEDDPTRHLRVSDWDELADLGADLSWRPKPVRPPDPGPVPEGDYDTIMDGCGRPVRYIPRNLERR